MKKNDLNKNKNKNLFTKKVKKCQTKRLIQNPRKLFNKKYVAKEDNYTSLYLNQTSPFYNNSINKFYFSKINSNNDFSTDKTCTTIKAAYTKLNLHKIKMNSSRPQSNSIKRLPILISGNNYPMNFTPNNYINLEEEKMNQEKSQLNKLIKFLNRQLNILKKENEEKDIMLNNKEKELNNILNKNNCTEEEKDVNSIIMNYNNDNNYNEECKTINNQSNSSYTLLLKIKKEIKKFKAKISEEDEKIKKLKSSTVYTKLKEINTENDLIEIQIKKISSLVHNALNIKEENDKKMEEILSFQYNIDVQKQILDELYEKKNVLESEELNLKNRIKNIETNIDLIKKQVLKNTKELDTLRKKNKNLLNDKVINSKIIIDEEDPNQNFKSYYTSKIYQLKKDIHFFKSKNVHDDMIKAKLIEQRKNILESLKQMKNLKIPPSLLSLKSINIQNESNKEQEQNNEEVLSEEKNNLDSEKINELKKLYIKSKKFERSLENKYKEYFDKFKSLYEEYKEQNKNQDININIEENNLEENNNKENNQNELEFGIDSNNPFFSDDEKNNPELNLKFNSTQYNQFTYILFKNFESKGIVSDESYTKIITPIIDFANEKQLKIVEYPSSEFDLIIEQYTKIILEVLNSNNKHNYILTKIFLSALLFNSGCDIEKMIEYFVILFSYTRNYKIEEEKLLKNLQNLYSKELKEISNAINNFIENNKEEEKYDENDEIYFPMIKVKELIEENQINLKDKYVEFLFYYLKQFDDKDSKLEYLNYTKLNKLLEQSEDNNIDIKQELTASDEEEKKLNTEPTKKEKFENIFMKKNLDSNIENINNEESTKKENINNEVNKTDDSATEITNEEYLKQLKESINLIKKGLEKENISFKNFVEENKKEMNYKGENIEYIIINDLNEKLKKIGIILSDLKLSCLCNKYSLENDLTLINIKSLEDDINSNTSQ